jgi:hypothetical protein
MVQIQSHHAIPNWPEENLPTLFIYRFGVLQYQFVGWQDFGIRSTGPTSKDDFELVFQYLQGKLSDLKVIDSVEIPDIHKLQDVTKRERVESRWGQFSGQMIGWKTTVSHESSRECDDLYDYDDVD